MEEGWREREWLEGERVEEGWREREWLEGERVEEGWRERLAREIEEVNFSLHSAHPLTKILIIVSLCQ